MIYCKTDELLLYLGTDATLDTAIRFVMQMDGGSLHMGRSEVDGDNVFINRFDYETMPEENLLYESHAQYADIHLLLSGREDILVAPEKELDEKTRDDQNDYIGLDGSWTARFRMLQGRALIVFPHEAHKVKCLAEKTCVVQKIVVKVRVGCMEAGV